MSEGGKKKNIHNKEKENGWVGRRCCYTATSQESKIFLMVISDIGQIILVMSIRRSFLKSQSDIWYYDSTQFHGSPHLGLYSHSSVIL